ncbi:MAG TPA: DUF1573 domain-containing protein [Cyclobacteriaceae bacterium]|nr:DUF1573 domain-containing protein [Cyclobacteriaceae bacterium]
MKARLILVLIAAVSLTACKDRDAEKKIAALEARLNSLEGKNTGAPAAVPGTEATPVQPAAEVKPEGPLPVLQFESTEYDFGTITQGKPVSHTFKFVNKGEAPLVIQSAQPTCGCTVSDYSKESIPVGGSGFVTAEFDAKAAGAQNKSITVTANTFPKQTKLTFKAMVSPKPDGQNGPVRQ